MFNRLNKKGFLFGPVFDIYSSVFICIAVVNVAVSQLPFVKKDFRTKKAVELCQEGYRGMVSTDCSATVAGMTDEQILAYIKDDIETPQVVMRERMGG